MIFLDIDGPLIPVRACLLTEQPGARLMVFDPIAVAMVNKLIEESDAAVVVSSIWRYQGIDAVSQLFCENGLNFYFHKDWCTTLVRGHMLRSMEIAKWLECHPEITNHVVIDDETIDHPSINAVKASTQDGMSFDNYLEAREYLNLPV